MRVLKTALLVCALASAAAAQSHDPLLADTRLSVHTLLREDVFAGFLENKADRVAVAERNLETLLELRPDQRGNLLAWRGAIAVQRAVAAHEAKNSADFTRYFNAAREDFAAAARTTNEGVLPITGGTFAFYGDRLPEEHRAYAWKTAYDNYSKLWKGQAAGVADMPVHFKGELLAGLTMSAQRTGKVDESAMFLDKMLTLLANTPYEATAKEWKENPASASASNLSCKNCHNSGRLAARVKALK